MSEARLMVEVLVMHTLLIWMVACGTDPDSDPQLGSPGDTPGASVDLGDLGTFEVSDEVTRQDLLARGELLPIEGDVSVAAVTARREAEVAVAEATVAAFLEAHPDLTDVVRLDIVDGPNVDRTPEGNAVVTPSGSGRVELHGPDLDVRATARVLAQREDPVAQRSVIGALRDATSGDCAELAADVDALEIERIHEVRADLERCAEDFRSLLFSADPFRQPGESPGEQVGNDEGCEPAELGGDVECVCGGEVQDWGEAGTDYAYTTPPDDPWVWAWGRREHLPPVRWQARRGSCVAFAAASALEYATSVRTGHTPDLSEQQLYSIGKYDLYQEHWGDGLPTSGFLDDLDDFGFTVGMESTWGYNPARCRLEVGPYVWSCAGYDHDACSDTTHQLGIYVFTEGPNLGPHWFRPDAGDDRVGVEEAVQFVTFAGNSLIPAMNLSEQGWGVVAALDVTERFRDIPNSGMLWTDPDDSEIGGHAVHVLRVVPSQLAPGGAVVVIKNSWGGGWGDHGYAYLSYEWFLDHLKSLTALRPSVAIDTPPTVTAVTPAAYQTAVPIAVVGDTVVPLEVQTDDAQEGPGCCTVRWWSSVEGHFAEGSAVEYRTTRPGTHLIAAIVEDAGGLVDDVWRIVEVTNEGPEVTLTRPRVPAGRFGTGLRAGMRVPVGVPVVFSGDAVDPDGFPDNIACGARAFTVDGATGRDFVGCHHEAIFDAPGWRPVSLRATDVFDAVGEDQRWIRAVEWGPLDPPFVQITWPPHDGFRVDGGFPVQLEATVVSGVGQIDARWTVTQGGVETVLGEGASVEWIPLPGVDSRPEITLKVTDANGTRSDTVRDVFVFVPPN